MVQLVVVRHGESEWNHSNRFTGFANPSLTQLGCTQAKQAGLVFKKEGLKFDFAYTSFLLRAQETLKIILEASGQEALPIQKSWRLNERHYGALQGLNKLEVVQKYGEEQVQIWRRSYDVAPPAVSSEDPRHPANDPLYKDVSKEVLPASESLKDTLKRLLPVWQELKAPLLAGQKLLIVAHGNSLRALYKHLFKVSKETIVSFNIPTGIPIVMELEGASLKGASYHFLGDSLELKKAIERTAKPT